jgi:acetyl-CoA synthetase
MTSPIPIPTERLTELNLAAKEDGHRIVWSHDTNIFDMTVGKFLSPDQRNKPAMIFEAPDGTTQVQSFAEIDRQSTNLAACLRSLGYGRGSFVGLHTGQHPDTAVAHMAVCKLGAIAVTLSQLYGPDTLLHALNDCALPVILTDGNAWGPMRAHGSGVPHLKHVLSRTPQNGDLDLAEALETDAPDFLPEFGGADDAALLMYTSGSTGKPKGILHAHRILAAYTPSIRLFFNLSIDDEDAVFWSPSDWAWVGGLLDMVFPAWMAGRPIATSLERFNADYAFKFMARHKVTHTFLAPTAIKRLAQTSAPRDQYDLSLRVICTGGEALAAETLNWSEVNLGVVCNEFYGMTEVNHLIGNCAAVFPRRPGSMGRAYPGHEVFLVDGDGIEVKPGDPGEIVTSASSPTRFLGYLNNREKDAAMQLGPYLRTHDLAVKDTDGYFWYKGRSDDLIKSSGFRIGPVEIEECLLSHKDVAEVAAIPKPDTDRGAIVKAFIKLRAGCEGTDALKTDLADHVRTRLAAYKAPREIEFVDAFELTSSGKINRRSLRTMEVAKAEEHR